MKIYKKIIILLITFIFSLFMIFLAKTLGANKSQGDGIPEIIHIYGLHILTIVILLSSVIFLKWLADKNRYSKIGMIWGLVLAAPLFFGISFLEAKYLEGENILRFLGFDFRGRWTSIYVVLFSMEFYGALIGAFIGWIVKKIKRRKNEIS